MRIDMRDIIESPMPNFDEIYSVIEHRQAFRFVLESSRFFYDFALYNNEMDYRANMHDLDKVFYLALGGDVQSASEYHRSHAPHHLGWNANPTREDLVEAIIDYESAGFTKLGKPFFNAYDTVVHQNKPYAAELIALMEQYELAESYVNSPDDPHWLQFRDLFQNIDEYYVLSELDCFFHKEGGLTEEILDIVRG